MREVLESKRAIRQRVRELSFSEKFKLLEKLRDRSLAIARNPLRKDRRIVAATTALAPGPNAVRR
jgi:hypothetical protein